MNKFWRENMTVRATVQREKVLRLFSRLTIASLFILQTKRNERVGMYQQPQYSLRLRPWSSSSSSSSNHDSSFQCNQRPRPHRYCAIVTWSPRLCLQQFPVHGQCNQRQVPLLCTRDPLHCLRRLPHRHLATNQSLQRRTTNQSLQHRIHQRETLSHTR
jgi:hypothetical protein